MPEKQVVRTDRAPAPFQGAPYSQAVRFGDLVFVSGQVAIDPATNQIVGSRIEEQSEQVLANPRSILEEAGSSLERVVKTTVYLADLADFARMNEVYGRHLGESAPARATIQAVALPSGALVEIDAVAHV